MDKTLDVLLERVFELEKILGEESNSFTFAEAISVIKKQTSVLAVKHGNTLGTLENFLLSFQGELNDNECTLKDDSVLWFQYTAPQILELVEGLEKLHHKIPDNFNTVISSISDFPNSCLAVKRLQFFTQQIMRLLVKSFLIIHRFACLAVTENEVYVTITKSLRDLKRRVLLLEQKIA